MNDTPCVHKYVNDGVRHWQPDRYPMPGGGAYRVLYARVYRCERCLDVRAERMEARSDSYQPARYGATPPTPSEAKAIG